MIKIIRAYPVTSIFGISICGNNVFFDWITEDGKMDWSAYFGNNEDYNLTTIKCENLWSVL